MTAEVTVMKVSEEGISEGDIIAGFERFRLTEEGTRG